MTAVPDAVLLAPDEWSQHHPRAREAKVLRRLKTSPAWTPPEQSERDSWFGQEASFSHKKINASGVFIANLHRTMEACFQPVTYPAFELDRALQHLASFPRIAAASTPNEIASFMRESSFDTVADRLEQLIGYAEEEPGEPELNMDSLRDLALWILQEDQLPPPRIGVDHDGLLTAEWRVRPSGGLMMGFSSDGQIQYAGVVNVRGDGRYQSIEGTSPKQKALELIRKFAAELDLL